MRQQRQEPRPGRPSSRKPTPTYVPSQPAQAVVLQRLGDDVDLSTLAEVLRVDRSTLYRLLGRDRLRFDAADRIAVALGRHPSELWPEWFTEGPA